MLTPHQRGGGPDPGERSTWLATTAQIRPGLWIGGAQAAIPGGVGTVVTLDTSSAAITERATVEVRAHFVDSRWQPVDRDTVAHALAAATTSPTAVLVRCRHGINRSALIAALALRHEGTTAGEAIERIVTARPGALTNPNFRDLIHTWPADPMRTAPRNH